MKKYLPSPQYLINIQEEAGVGADSVLEDSIIEEAYRDLGPDDDSDDTLFKRIDEIGGCDLI